MLQVQGNGGARLSSSHSADKGHTVGAGPSRIVQHPPQAPAVMETAVDSSLFSFESSEGICRMVCVMDATAVRFTQLGLRLIRFIRANPSNPLLS